MDIRRATFAAAIRLAIVLSTSAVVLAFALEAGGDVSPVAFIAAVIIVGFVTSWIVTGRVARSSQLVSYRHPSIG
jgi:hypothetical protein